MGKRVAIFGAGIAGLSAAHELALKGFQVEVFESKLESGGFFRSDRREDGMPTEYSWHGFGPWYNNTFDIMKQIPFDSSGSIFDRALSRPIDFGIFPPQGLAGFFNGILSIPQMFQLSKTEFIRSSWIMLKAWCSDLRSQEIYSQVQAVEAWKNVLEPKALKNWRACFGPWIGSDWNRVSYHTTGSFFCKQLLTNITHLHPPDEEGGEWLHGRTDGWLLLKGPSNEYWFDKWVGHLKGLGVVFHFNSKLINFEANKGRIEQAYVELGLEMRKIQAESYILAINPYFAKEALFKSPGLESTPEAVKLYLLTQTAPHIQISFRIGFQEKIAFPKKRMAMILAETEYNITLFAQEQAWSDQVEIGKGIGSLWTGTACIDVVPGRIFNRPTILCEKEQFEEEIIAQILSSTSLNQEIQKANQGRSLSSFSRVEFEIWPEWQFSSDGIQTPWPKWVNDSQNQRHLPGQKTSVNNLYFAGAHTKTQADVWSIEAAVESGRRAAKEIEPSVKVIEQSIPKWLCALRRVDNYLYKKGLINVVDMISLLAAIGLLLAIF